MDWIDEVCDPDFALKVVIEEDSDAEHLKRLQINIGKLYNAWGSQCTKLVQNLQDYASLRGPRSWRVQASTQLQLGALVFDTLQQQTSAKTKQAGFGALGLCVAHTTKMMRACSELMGQQTVRTCLVAYGCVPIQKRRDGCRQPQKLCRGSFRARLSVCGKPRTNANERVSIHTFIQ